MSDTARTMYVNTINRRQAEAFRDLLERQGWELDTIPYALWRARRAKTTAVAYESGKLTIQGRDTAEVVTFVLEPLVLKEVRFGYETALAREEDPEMFQPHAGIDESGKGDYFGPLVIGAAYVDEVSAQALMDAGVRDSKSIRGDRKIEHLAREIRRIVAGKFALVRIGPEAYNRLYTKFSNVNRLLAWGHARALEDLLERQPDCPRALSDQFGRKSQVKRALMERGRNIVLQQRTKAESDIAVAAASILARHEFVVRLRRLGEGLDIDLPKGASARVVDVAREVVRRAGPEALERLAKLHFKTTAQVLRDGAERERRKH